MALQVTLRWKSRWRSHPGCETISFINRLREPLLRKKHDDDPIVFNCLSVKSVCFGIFLLPPLPRSLFICPPTTFNSVTKYPLTAFCKAWQWTFPTGHQAAQTIGVLAWRSLGWYPRFNALVCLSVKNTSSANIVVGSCFNSRSQTELERSWSIERWLIREKVEIRRSLISTKHWSLFPFYFLANSHQLNIFPATRDL